MASLEKHKVYRITQDHAFVRVCHGRLLFFEPNMAGRATAVFDVREDKEREASLWGDFVRASPKYEDTDLLDFVGSNAPVTVTKLGKLPVEGAAANCSGEQTIGRGSVTSGSVSPSR